jgi:outer membrane protein OmpA-like peptidoglycan-associated protein
MDILKIKRLFPLIIFFFASIFIQAQEDTNPTTVEDTMEMSAFEEGAESFPAKPLDMWELGVHGGAVYLSSDLIAAWPGGFGAGLHLRKSLGYTLSLRADFMYAQAKGTDNREVGSALRTNKALRDLGYGDVNFVRNYKSNIISGNLQAIISLSNILFHQAEPKWNLYALAGAGLYYFDTKYDALDANGELYDFSGISFDADDARDQVKDLLDGDYETDAVNNSNTLALNEDGNILLNAQAGIGISRKITDRVNLSLEHIFMFTFTDYVDGYSFRTSSDRSTSRDNLSYTNIRVNFNIGSFDKRVEPLYWVNPLKTPYNDIAALKQRPKLDLTDADNDGVIDMFDEDTDTPEGVEVDVEGNPLDTDNDGIPDYKDEELFSPQGYKVNEKGVAQVDDPYMRRSEVEAMVDGKVNEVKLDWWLPMINFDLDEYQIEPRMVPALDQIATVVKNNPNIDLVVKGYADNRADEDYNDVLSYKRSLAAITYLVDRYELDRERFIIQYGGEAQPLIQDLPDQSNVAKDVEEQHFINRRVEFKVAGPNDKPMDKPKGPDAGEKPKEAGPDYKGHKNIGY